MEELKMSKNTINCVEQASSQESKKLTNTPLFIGDYRRDTAVSELEKAAEASQAIYNSIKSRIKKR